MNKIIICLVSMMCLVGCDTDKNTVSNANDTCKSVQISHVKTKWKQDSIELDEIDGHLYLVGRIINRGHGSRGVCSIIHSPSCHCKKTVDK